MVTAMGASIGAQADDAADRAAIKMLQQAVTVAQSGEHNRLLRALRHLKDPALRPLFVDLAIRTHPALQIHGILGLAELSEEQSLDLARVASIDDDAVHGELISAALDADLLTDEQGLQMLDWPGMDTGAKLLIATKRIAEDKPTSTKFLVDNLDASKLGRRAMAALLLHHLGDQRGYTGLQALDQSNDPARDAVRAMLLTTAMKHNLNRTANWAYALAIEPDINPGLGLLALQTAMRYGDPRAAAQWRTRFESAAEPVARIRLAMIALHLSPFVPPETFDVLIAQDDPLLARIGKAGRAIADDNPALADEVVALIQLLHPVANRWALNYAREEAAEDNAMLILLALIDAYERGPDDRGRARRLDDAVNASQALFERSPDMAVNLLRPILANDATDPLLRQGILLGLVRSGDPDAHVILEGLPAFNHPDTIALGLLLLTRSQRPLTDNQLRDLALMIRGGGAIEDSLRMQAAWAYLKMTGQDRKALAAALESQP